MSVPPTEVRCLLDPDGMITEIDEDIKSLLGYGCEECRGRFLGDLVHSAHRSMLDPLLTPTAADPAPKEMTVALVDCEGATVYVWLRGEAVFSENGQLQEIRGLLRDVTVPRWRERRAEEARAQLEARLRQVTIRDVLTGLYNRLYFEKRIAEFDTAGLTPVSILICDIDGLKDINEALGFEKGNELLVDAARLISTTFRQSDIPARTAGSQFSIILPKTDENGLGAVRQRLRRVIADFNQKKSPCLNITMGAATVNAPHQDLRKVYLQAENFMCRKKLHRPKSVRNSMVQVLLTALAERDFITETHAERLGHYATMLGTAIGLDEHKLPDLKLLAHFHDIGKLAVPDRILFKPGPLDPEERIRMNRHPEVGYRIALSCPDLVPIADKILTHHEWWNGKGYPLQIRGTDIPMECRILAVVDAYDAMTNDRPYRKAMSHRDAMQELVRCSGSQFDPKVLRAFIKLNSRRKETYACQA